jgi:hypothetical protein
MIRCLFFWGVVSLFFIASTVQGQTLQFSQVLLVSTTQTVPANKVWKVEGFMPSQSLIAPWGSTVNFSITVNNSQIFVAGAFHSHTTNGSGGVAQTGYAANLVFQPLWLPAGTTLAAGTNVFGVSVIEFTVVP